MPNEIQETYDALKQAARSGLMRPIATRRAALKSLRQTLKDSEQEILEAAKSDLGRPHFETFVLELAMIHEEINLALKNLHHWSRKRPVPTPLIMMPGRSYIEPTPLGLVLIIAPWNYPLQLSLVPLIAAIAAGNCVILKPSELAPACALLLKKLLSSSLKNFGAGVITGAVDTAKNLLEKSFDHIFYTGSTSVGIEVMAKAAVHLTPVTLELGGKSPCIVNDDADIKLAAKRIMWGKFLNSGQTCIAPDYVLIHHTRLSHFVTYAQEALTKMYGDKPQESESYGRIINRRHTERLVSYLDGGDVVHGGGYDLDNKFIEPTLITNIKAGAPLLSEEIFGPLLPIIGIDNIDEAINIINDKTKPLALYLFAKDKALIERISQETSPGGMCINDCISHAGVSGLPFGGVGHSGMGRYHGQFGFEAFSHLRGVHIKPNVLDNPIKYAPYSKNKLSLAKMIMS